MTSLFLSASAISVDTKSMPSPTPPSPGALVDALNNTFGKHEGKRASHAKGVCAIGEFSPAANVTDLVNNSLLKAKKVPAVVRFSVGGGNPNVSDKSRSVRGLAIRLEGSGQTYDLVLISEPVFFAATPASFVSFLEARVPDPATGKPDPQKIAAYNALHPDGKRQPALLASHAAPASYATTPYFSNNAFVFKNAKNVSRYARIVVEPLAGTRYLTEDEEKTFPDKFLQDELVRRVAQSPASFKIYAQLPSAEDSLTDPSTIWNGVEKIEMGTLKVTQVVDDDQCDGLVFVPVTLPDGITPSDDPILQSRAAAYAVSLSRRLKEKPIDYQMSRSVEQEKMWKELLPQQPFLLRLARLQLGSLADAEDAVQETMVAAIKGWDGFQHKSNLKSWLTGILRHKIVDQIRQRRSQLAAYSAYEEEDSDAEFDQLFTADGAWHPDVFVDTLCGETKLAQRQLLDIVELCMRRLPEETARLFLMREYLGFDLAEIEESCAISSSNLRVLLYRARMRLRECAVRSWGEL